MAREHRLPVLPNNPHTSLPLIWHLYLMRDKEKANCKLVNRLKPYFGFRMSEKNFQGVTCLLAESFFIVWGGLGRSGICFIACSALSSRDSITFKRSSFLLTNKAMIATIATQVLHATREISMNRRQNISECFSRKYRPIAAEIPFTVI